MPENDTNGNSSAESSESTAAKKERLERLVQQIDTAMDKSRTNVAESAGPKERAAKGR